MEYPITGQMFSQIAVDRLIKAKPNDTADLQLFKIYEITKPINGIVTINAEHISYALSHYPVKNITASGNAAIVIQAILDNANNNLSKNHGFSVATTTGMTATNNFSYMVGSARSALGGSEGSVLDVFGGEYEFDNYIIRLHKNRGKDTGVLVAYGKNLTDVKVTTSMEGCYTHLFPYCLKDDVLTTTSRIAVTNTSGIAERVLIKDFTSFFEDDEEITSSAITTKARAWLAQNDINTPDINVSVSFLHLWQSPEYADVAVLEKVSLCDYVTVRHPQLAVDIKAQVTKTVYDVLAERYEKIELGSAKANFADTMKQATTKLQETIQLMKKADNTSAITAAYTAAIETATKAITGNSGGYVLLNPEKNPQEILIMNTANKNTATKMWRWNLSGLGYSSNGYNGPFTTAITMNGAIVADFITTGSLTANIIKAGILSSADGKSYFNLESGLIHTANAEIVGGSISIGGTKYKTVIENGSLKQHTSNGTTEVGGLIPVISGSNQYQAIYVSKLSDAKGVSMPRLIRITEFFSEMMFLIILLNQFQDCLNSAIFMLREKKTEKSAQVTNFGILRDNHSGKILGPAPIFDNGLSLFNFAMPDDFNNLSEYAKTRSTPYGVSFESICTEVIGKKQTAQLRKLLGFRFNRHPSINLPEERLQAIEKHIEVRARELLSLPRSRTTKNPNRDVRLNNM